MMRLTNRKLFEKMLLKRPASSKKKMLMNAAQQICTKNERDDEISMLMDAARCTKTSKLWDEEIMMPLQVQAHGLAVSLAFCFLQMSSVHAM